MLIFTFRMDNSNWLVYHLIHVSLLIQPDTSCCIWKPWPPSDTKFRGSVRPACPRCMIAPCDGLANCEWKRSTTSNHFFYSTGQFSFLYRLHPPRQSSPAAPLVWGSDPAFSSPSPAPWCWCSHPLHLVQRCRRQPWTLQQQQDFLSSDTYSEYHLMLCTISTFFKLIRAAC